MRVHRLIFIISLILLSALLPQAISPADASFEAIPTTTTPPVIDGNVSDSSEWLDSGNFTIKFGGPHSIDANLYFTTNDTHMFILMNYTTEYYASVNATIPEPYNVTIENGTEPSYNITVVPTYNNQTHDWWSIVFDNNLDSLDWEETTTPDDALIINRYFNESADAQLFSDVSILNNTIDVLNKTLYNDTLLEDTNTLLNGTNDLISSMNYTTAVDSDLTTVTIELTKPLYNSADENGSDFDLAVTRALSFKVFFWENQTNYFANTSDLFAHSLSSEWLGYHSPLYEDAYLATQPVNSSISIDLRGISTAERVYYNSFVNSLLINNYDVGQIGSDITLDALNSANLTILIVNTHAYTADEVSAIYDYVRFGGQLMIIVGSKGQTNADNLLEDLSISTVSSVLLLGENDTGIPEFTADLTDTLPFMNELTSFTNGTIGSVTVSNVTALNLTLMDEQTLFEQKYSYHSVMDVFTGLFIDLDDNGSYNAAEDMLLNANYSLGAVFELYFGGRISIFSSLDLIGRNFYDTDNYDLFFRMMQWNAKFIDETVTHFEIVTPNVLEYHEEAYFEANVTFKDGLVFANAIVTAEIYRAGNLVDSFILTEDAPGNYAGLAVMNFTGVLSVKIVTYQTGYGYSSSDFYPVLVEILDYERNAPNALMVIIGLANIGIVILFGLRFAVFRKSE
ncbi:MAG: hypothetical protein ACTSYA_12035 [Candidatus Kariarchaeaceae archaeon]